jgi:hypothetical protein
MFVVSAFGDGHSQDYSCDIIKELVRIILVASF